MRFQNKVSASKQADGGEMDDGTINENSAAIKSKSTITTPSNGLVLIACFSLALVLMASNCIEPVECEEQLSVESRQLKDNENELADTIKYLEKLEKLDKFWSEMARPRFGRSKYKQTGAHSGYEQQQPAARYGSSLVDLINSRLAQKYYSNDAY